jgi:CRISPR system Cascade subunit CasA
MADWLADLVARGSLDPDAVVPVEYFGLGADRAKPLFWRHERLPLPLSYLRDQDLCGDLSDALGLAEQAARDLRATVWGLARLLLAPEADHAEARQPASEDARRLAEALAPEPRYWPRLEAPFKQLLVELPAARAADAVDGGQRRIAAWASTVEQAVRTAFGETVRGLDTSARALKATAFAERQFGRRLHETFQAYRELVGSA